VNRWFLLVAAAPALAAQSVDVYSEFQRVDPYGEIVAPDRSPSPREILSPGVPRNGWATFHVAVHAPANTSYLLYVMTNPRDACRVEMYKEHFSETAAGWIPDRLTALRRLPDYGFMPDPDDSVPEQNTRVYLLDLWIPPDSGVGRFRLEVQLKTGTWVVRPMEIRVLEAKIPGAATNDKPEGPVHLSSLPPIASPADAAAAGALGNFLAGGPMRSCPVLETVRAAICRNAEQDMALAREVAKPDTVREWWWSFNLARAMGAEWWLRMRDLVFAAAAGR
jgi:hypothetical protein